jgi:tetratricopeptide (TPR) repeat protein
VTDDASPYPFDLGSFSRPTSTSSAEAQRWFDRGLGWSYAFNHEEAIRCFERAIAFDEGFALAHWGLAYAAGPNYNKQWEAFDEVDLRTSLRRAYDASGRAEELAATASPVEQALIRALTRERNGRGLRRLRRRPRCRRAVRGLSDEPDALGAVGLVDRRAG